MSEPIVSVIVPAYNAARHIGATLSSCLAQSLREIEIIVVDDGSTDRTYEVMRSFDDPRLKLHRKPNGGVSSARNHALIFARGRYVQFLDADDVLAPTKLEFHVEKLRNAGDCGISTSKWGWFVNDIEDAIFAPAGDWKDLSPVEFAILKFGGNGMMPPNSWLMPRGLIMDLRFQSAVDIFEDGLFLAQMVKRSTRIVFAEKAVSYYRKQNPLSLTAQYDYDNCFRQYASISLVADTLMSMDSGERMRQALSNAFLNSALRSHAIAPDLAASAERKSKEYGTPSFDPLASGGVFGRVGQVVGWKRAVWLRYRYIKLARKLVRS